MICPHCKCEVTNLWDHNVVMHPNLDPATGEPRKPGLPGKHTPGPWLVQGSLEQPEVWADCEDPNGGQVCALSTVGAYQAAQTEFQVQANARLIAAAPELLDALKAALSYAQNPGDWIFKYGEGPGFMMDAVIAKAEGRA